MNLNPFIFLKSGLIALLIMVFALPVSAANMIMPSPVTSSAGSKVFIFGGLTPAGSNFKNDVWSSAGNLSTWSQVSAQSVASSTKWSPRGYFASAYFNNKIWVINGMTGPSNSDTSHEVWSSADGVNWTLEVPQAPWAPGEGGTLTVFQNKLWLIGGGKSASGNGVWSSPDGINWTQVAAPTVSSCIIRWTHQTAVFQNKLWVIGNSANSASTGYDICSSPDGIHWTSEVAYAPWNGTKSQFTMLSHNNKLWVIGGHISPYGPQQSGATNDVWSSTDGVNWVRVTANAPWPVRQGQVGFVYNGKMWIAGGVALQTAFLSDVWSSTDGITWTQSTNMAWPTRAHFGVVVTSTPLTTTTAQSMRPISRTVSNW